MAFVTINGWRIEVSQGGASRDLMAQGELSPAWSNRPLRRRQALAKKLSFTTVPLDADDATTLEGLLEGRGHYWPFNFSLHSSAGLGPEAGYSAANIGFSETTNGPASLALQMNTGSMVFDTQLPDDWTISYMTSTSATSGWSHRVIRSDGAKWLDGVRNDALVLDEVYVSSSATVLFSSSPRYFAQLVVLPFGASDSFISSLRPGASKFSSLPRLDIGGDINGGKTIEMMGTNAGQSYVQRAGWTNNKREVQVELEEVVPRQEGPTMPFRAHTSFVFDEGTLSGTTRRPIIGDFTPLTNAGQTYTTTLFIPGRRFLSMDGTQTGEYSSQDMTNSLQGASIISGIVAYIPTSFAPISTDVMQIVDNVPTLSQFVLYLNSTSINAGSTPTNTSEQTVTLSHTFSLGYLYVLGLYADFSANRMGVGWCRGITTGVYGVPLASDWNESGVSFTATSFSAPTARPVNFFRNWTAATSNNPRGTGIYSALVKNRRISESDLRQTYRAIVAGNFR